MNTCSFESKRRVASMILLLWTLSALGCASTPPAFRAMRKESTLGERRSLLACEKACLYETSGNNECSDDCWEQLVVHRLRAYFRFQALDDPIAWVDKEGNLNLHFGHLLLLPRERKADPNAANQILDRIATRVRGSVAWEIKDKREFLGKLARYNNTLEAEVNGKITWRGAKKNTVRVNISRGMVNPSDLDAIKAAFWQTGQAYMADYGGLVDSADAMLPRFPLASHILIGSFFIDPNGYPGIKLDVAVHQGIVYTRGVSGGAPIEHVPVLRDQICPVRTESIFYRPSRDGGVSSGGAPNLVQHIFQNPGR